MCCLENVSWHSSTLCSLQPFPLTQSHLSTQHSFDIKKKGESLHTSVSEVPIKCTHGIFYLEDKAGCFQNTEMNFTEDNEQKRKGSTSSIIQGLVINNIAMGRAWCMGMQSG